jgi:hypothetical protein
MTGGSANPNERRYPAMMLWLIIGAVIIGGLAGAWWSMRQPDPNPKNTPSAD